MENAADLRTGQARQRRADSRLDTGKRAERKLRIASTPDMSSLVAQALPIDYGISTPLEIHSMSNRYQLIYLSHLAEHASPTCVAELVREARQRNLASGINSLLVFDGWRFCQTLEGEQAVVCHLADRIRADERHAGFRVLFQGESQVERLLARSSLDYALSYDDSLGGFDTVHG